MNNRHTQNEKIPLGIRDPNRFLPLRLEALRRNDNGGIGTETAKGCAHPTDAHAGAHAKIQRNRSGSNTDAHANPRSNSNSNAGTSTPANAWR